MLCQLSIGKRITKLHGMTYKITVPVNSCQQRYFSRFYSFRKSIHKLIGTISVPIICHLKIKLMVVIHLIGCIQTRLIAWYRVIEIGVMTHFNGIHPTLIPTELDRLFSGCQLPFIIQLNPPWPIQPTRKDYPMEYWESCIDSKTDGNDRKTFHEIP